MNIDLEHLRFPIGSFSKPAAIGSKEIKQFISTIEAFPEKLKQAVESLTEAELNLTYRPGGWTIRQVVHHCADSHMHSFTRFKLALTEDKPTIKPYFEERWAELADSQTMPLEPSLLMLAGIHQRWSVLLKSMKPEQFQRSLIHPQHGTEIALDENLGFYAWHCEHHLAHVYLALN